MKSRFELTEGNVESLLCRCLENYSTAELTKQSINGFKLYRLSGPPDTATLKLIVNQHNQHFEFAVGRFIIYEGDYPVYPASRAFLEDLLLTVLDGHIEEKRFNFFFPNLRNPSRISAVVKFKSHKHYVFSRNLCVLGLMARVESEKSYKSYFEN